MENNNIFLFKDILTNLNHENKIFHDLFLNHYKSFENLKDNFTNFVYKVKKSFITNLKPITFEKIDFSYLFFTQEILSLLQKMKKKELFKLNQKLGIFVFLYLETKHDYIHKIMSKFVKVTNFPDTLLLNENLELILNPYMIKFKSKYVSQCLVKKNNIEIQNEIFNLKLKINSLKIELIREQKSNIMNKNYYLNLLAEYNMMIIQQKEKIINLNEIIKEKDDNNDVSKLNENLLCIICLNNNKSMIGKECKHFSCCMNCSLKLDKKCPICRNTSGFDKIFFN